MRTPRDRKVEDKDVQRLTADGMALGIDPNQKNLTAGSYAKYGNGGGVETYALARVESDANNPAIFRVTTASTDAGTAIGVQEAILSQLLP